MSIQTECATAMLNSLIICLLHSFCIMVIELNLLSNLLGTCLSFFKNLILFVGVKPCVRIYISQLSTSGAVQFVGVHPLSIRDVTKNVLLTQ